MRSVLELTTIQWFYVASIGGALLFFAAGALVVMLRRQRGAAELVRLTNALADAETLAREHASTSSKLRTQVETSAEQHVETQRRLRETTAALAEAEAVLRGSQRDVAQTQARLLEVEQELAARVAAARDHASETDRLQRRLADAEALRSDYVRLRTTVTEGEFLKREVVRLEEELRAAKVNALSGPTLVQPRRAPRGSTGMPAAPRSISESLAWAIERFADQGTRGSAVADTLGFPLAASGDDGVSLAAYGALVMETANRAKQFLPLAMPRAVEIVDERGARVSVWTFDVGADPLLLVNLAVSPVDDRKVEATLADLATILAPSSIARGA